MNQYTEEQYKAKFGEQAWRDKVLAGNEDYEIESVYATDTGNIFMVMTKSEM